MKRYTLTVDQCGALYAQPVGDGPDIEPEETSEWVRYEDVANLCQQEQGCHVSWVEKGKDLEAELERLRRMRDDLLGSWIEQQKEVERLRAKMTVGAVMAAEERAEVAETSLAAANARIDCARAILRRVSKATPALAEDIRVWTKATDDLAAQPATAECRCDLGAVNCELHRLGALLAAERERIKAETDAGVAEFGETLAAQFDPCPCGGQARAGHPVGRWCGPL